jgi:hypothetical protein
VAGRVLHRCCFVRRVPVVSDASASGIGPGALFLNGGGLGAAWFRRPYPRVCIGAPKLDPCLLASLPQPEARARP